MSHMVVVTVKGMNDEIYGPDVSQEEAEKQLAEVRSTLGTANTPNLPWIGVMGGNILAVRIIESGL